MSRRAALILAVRAIQVKVAYLCVMNKCMTMFVDYMEEKGGNCMVAKVGLALMAD